MTSWKSVGVSRTRFTGWSEGKEAGRRRCRPSVSQQYRGVAVIMDVVVSGKDVRPIRK